MSAVANDRGKRSAGNGPNLWTSPDTDVWTALPTSTSRTGFNRMLSLGTDGLLVPASNDTLYLSEDALAWESTPVITPTSTNSLRAAAAANGTVVVVGTGGRIVQARTRSPVATPPQVAVNPQPQFVPVGQNITLTVGAPVVGTSYQWSRNGEPIEGATNATFVVSGAQPSDNGSYTAVLTNFSGSTTAMVVGGLVVRDEPVPTGARAHRLVFELPVTAATWIAVDASGDEPLPVEMTGTYQQEKGRPGVVPFAVINPILLTP